MATAAISLNPCSDRPALISRHSSCLPLIHTRPAGRNGTRRCRSASPPVKKKTNKSMNSANPGETLKTGIDAERGLSIRQDEDDWRISAEMPKLLHRQPIIKQLTSSYSVKQPRPSKGSHKVLPDRSNPVLAPADLNGNLIRSNSYCLPGDISKTRKVEFSRHFTLPADAYRQYGWHTTEPLRKRKSFSNNNAPSTRLIGMQSLPVEMKLRIFSYLTHMEKGACMYVCKEWYDVIKQPALWRVINFREFMFCYSNGYQKLETEPNTVEGHATDMDTVTRYKEVEGTGCTQACYSRYIYRIEGFIAFLIDLQPQIRWLAFSFDLISDNWWATVHKFLLHTDLRALKYADINWRDTPTKPHYLDESSLALNDIIYKARRRERKFLDFLDLFTKEAANLETLITPFVWYDRPLTRLTCFKRLKNLSLEKYFIFRSVKQSDLDFLLDTMTGLERLLLELWGTSKNPQEFAICSQSLRYLDLSQCRFFYIRELRAPSLEVLVMPTSHPFAESQHPSPCLADVIRVGAPALKRLNHISMQSLDDLDINSQLADFLYQVCKCHQHKHRATSASEESA